MSGAVWAASRAGVRRRATQTGSIGVAVALATATLVFGLGLLSASRSMFDDAFAAARGAHAAADFDAAKTTEARVAATAHAPGVTAAAGPFRTATLARSDGPSTLPMRPEGLTVAGRADPGGPVDRLTLVSGRWVRGPGEIVLRGKPKGPFGLGGKVASRGNPELTVVGFAVAATDGPGGWVTPAQVAALRPDAFRMEYRFARAGSAAEVRRSLAAATAGLPVRGQDSYVTAKRRFEGRFNQLIPFITVFGILALTVSAFIIGNVVSGAVVSGFRHIGVMKALGFTPGQVTSVYVVMVAVPAVLGCAAGLVAGHLLAGMMAANLSADFELPSAGGVSLPLEAAAGGGVLALAGLAALVPALRAGRLPAVQAISAGTVSRRGRGRRVQRWLVRTRLPLPVGLGLGLPVARPARAAVTLAGLCLGVTAVTMGFGLHTTVTKIMSSDTESRTSVMVGADPRGGPGRPPGPSAGGPSLSAEQLVAAVRARPGTAHVTAAGQRPVRVAGLASEVAAETYAGDYRPFLGDGIVRGRWFARPGEVVPSEAFMRLQDLRVGDVLSVQADGRPVTLRIVGAFAHPDTDRLMLDAASLPAAARGAADPPRVLVIVKPGTDPAAYAKRINEAGASTGMFAETAGPELADRAVFSGLFLLFSLVICLAAALGVLNGVLLGARERARDLGVLKAVGMPPRRVVLMMVTSMAALGVAAGVLGVPLGVLAHHGVITLTGEMLGSGMAAPWIHVYGWTLLLPPACVGLAVAVLGAWPPAARAAAVRTVTALRSE
ncbi:ABC transporter permease [Actinomadura chibensis]|uniref:ABC transporter permease n=1 Tax=Actinomadura chibensis TaxID=392828 RepID=A0A5D0NQ70_9ACTN|nr:ABC transporter permease [Actinomadura chibensis]TYB46636.1 ABC transporter permease [Actinomadura chibensis]